MAFFVSVDKSAHEGENLTGWILAQESRSLYPVTVVMAGWSTCYPGFSMHHEKSRFFTAILITRGSAEWKIRNTKYVLNPGDVALEQIDAPVELRSRDQDGFQQMFVRFEGPSVRGITAQLGLEKQDYLRVPDGHPALDMVKEIVLTGNGEKDYSDEILSTSAYRLLLFLAGVTEREQLPEKLTRVLRYVGSNQNKQLTVGGICRDVGLSRSSLVRLFRDHLGRSPLQYVLEQKIELSKSLIASGRFSLKEIAYKLGYTSQTYFSRQFTQLTGQSPREFAEENRKR